MSARCWELSQYEVLEQERCFYWRQWLFLWVWACVELGTERVGSCVKVSWSSRFLHPVLRMKSSLPNYPRSLELWRGWTGAEVRNPSQLSKEYLNEVCTLNGETSLPLFATWLENIVDQAYHLQAWDWKSPFWVSWSFQEEGSIDTVSWDPKKNNRVPFWI